MKDSRREFVTDGMLRVGTVFRKRNDSFAHAMMNAYEKLYAQFYLDHDIKIGNRKTSQHKSIFDAITDEELDMMVESVANLLQLYNMQAISHV